MVAIQSLVVSLLLAASTWKTELCNLSPRLQKILCPRENATTVTTPIGVAHGAADTGATRFAVKYAAAPRWLPPVPATAWELPNNSTDVTALPVPCAQLDDNLNSLGTEDWGATIHGGSFTSGSATAAGLDGSNLAAATNSIVAVIQYRLGALGFLDPSGGHNFGVMDVIAAMGFLQAVVPSFGGDGSITIAGQSSGANMVRALLAIPAASSLFQSAILHSDPMDYGFLSTSVHDQILSTFTGDASCDASDVACFKTMSLDDIMSAQSNFQIAVWNNNIPAAAGQFEPIRPVLDGEMIPNPLDLTASFPSQSKPIIVSTVRNEAGSTIYQNFLDPISTATYESVVSFTFDEPRTSRILATAVYAASPDVNGVDVDQRPILEELGTDQIWRCASWTFARNWVGAGGKAFVGEYKVGATYPGNDAVPFCTAGGSVCHQDDIEIIFGTVPSPTTAQTALTKEMQARYANFMRTGSPNADGFAAWSVAGTDNVNAINLGAPGLATVGACNTSYWGNFVQYDYQVFDL
ncbi:alpha/beta-hydrolase [Epithele typhae]|uniref:alpha/beta-hydrolase n=1 Tax=Epithele typhae TaxID=378194 RepID=UPI002007727C|nr:alpha/beta-hydrolase [Epithele typhae]KAH9945835.1 alpha/beta-hydrolase [Epithele typhae]